MGLKIAIASGKGGTGKTFISTNLFNSLSDYSKTVTLVDCDAEEPNDSQFIHGDLLHSIDVYQKIPEIIEENCVYCGKCESFCNYNAIFLIKDINRIQVLEELCHGCGACTYACKHNAVIEKDDLLGKTTKFKINNNTFLIEARMKVGVYSPVKVIKEAIKEGIKSDLVILDSPPGTSCSFIQTTASADYIVLVTEPTPFGLSNLIQSVETLKSINKPYGVIINRDNLGNNEVYEYLRIENIPLLMSIPFDKEIAVKYSNGELITNSNNEWKIKFIQLYKRIIENYADSNY